MAPCPRLNVRAEDKDDTENLVSVERHMRELMRVPGQSRACPAHEHARLRLRTAISR